MKTCSVEGCERKSVARGLCATHYSFHRQRGTLPGGPPRKLAPKGAPAAREKATRRPGRKNNAGVRQPESCAALAESIVRLAEEVMRTEEETREKLAEARKNLIQALAAGAREGD